MINKTLIFCIISITFFSCKKNNTCNAPIEAAGKKEVFLTETIKLTAYGKAKSTQNYEWTGPNNFSATGTSIEIPMADYNMAGKYSVRATDNQSCISDYYYFDITVKDIIAPCSLPTNSIYTTDFGNYENLNVYTYNSENYYSISLGNLRLDFASSTIPDGVYAMTPNFPGAYQIRGVYTYTPVYYSVDYYSYAGTIAYVKTINGHLNITFCDVCFEDFNNCLISTHIIIP